MGCEILQTITAMDFFALNPSYKTRCRSTAATLDMRAFASSAVLCEDRAVRLAAAIAARGTTGVMDQAEVAKKATRRTARFLFAIAVIVFLSAGTLDYWQGWLFVAVHTSCIVLITAYFLRRDPALIARRLRAGARAEKQETQKTIMRIANVFFVALIVFPGIDHRFGWSQAPPVVAWVGAALVAAGELVIFIVFRENSFASAIIEVGENQPVVTTGPYRLVRHPMYAGALLLIAGIPTSLGSLWGLSICIPLVLIIVWRLLAEERYLSEHLAGYADYCAATRYRLVPGVF
jgi:protein-S-isoprenylcysteine O-methyltransferase Ste14